MKDRETFYSTYTITYIVIQHDSRYNAHDSRYNAHDSRYNAHDSDN